MKKFITSFQFPQLSGNLRLGVWCLLLLLTLLIFLYPTKLEIRYAPVESIYVFHNLPLFGVLYYGWFALILVLLFLPGSNRESWNWENVALLIIFALVFSGIWVNLSRGYYHCDTWAYAGRIQNSLQKGYLDDILTGGPVEFPILVLLGCEMSQILGLNIFNTIMVILLVQILLFAILWYSVFVNLLNDGRLASFATLMVLSANLICDFAPQFHPRIFVMLYLITCLVLITKDKPVITKSASHNLLFLILLMALIMTHLINSYVFLLILLGIYLVQKVSKSNIISLQLIILTLMGILAYGLFFSPSLTNHTFGHFTLIWETFLHGSFFDPFSMIGISNNIGQVMPLWANITIIFWLLIMGLGGILGIRNLLRIRRVNGARQIEVGGLVGTTIFACMAFLSQGLAEASWRFFFFLMPFTTSIVFSFLSTFKARIQRIILVASIILVFIISFPTFLAHNDNVGMHIFLPTETSPEIFLGTHYEELDRPKIRLVTPIAPIWMTPYYIHDVWRMVYPYVNNPLQTYPDIDELYKTLGYTIKSVKSGFDGQASISLFIYSPRYIFEMEYVAGLASHINVTTDIRWQEAMSELAKENLIYNNRPFQIYLAVP
jgi:hypothetical protein